MDAIVYTRNDDLMNAATLVLFNGSVKQYGFCTHGGIEESLLSKCKKTTRYIIISEIDDDLKTPNDKQMLIGFFIVICAQFLIIFKKGRVK